MPCILLRTRKLLKVSPHSPERFVASMVYLGPQQKLHTAAGAMQTLSPSCVYVFTHRRLHHSALLHHDT